MAVLLALVLAVPVGGPFGEATAGGSPAPAGMVEIELEVEVAAAGGTVVAHLIDPGQEQQTVALGERPGGTFGGLVDIEPNNLVVVFELLRDGDDARSDPVTLVQLGVDPELLGVAVETAASGGEERISNRVRQWGWVALAFGAASLSLLAVWALGGGPGPARRGRAADDEAPLPDQEEASAGTPDPEGAEPEEG